MFGIKGLAKPFFLSVLFLIGSGFFYPITLKCLTKSESFPAENPANQPNQANQINQAKEFSIFFTSDIHGHALPYFSPLLGKTIGSLGSVANLLEACRRNGQNFLYFDVGDLFQGTLEDAESKGGIPGLIFNDPQLKLDGRVLGNHEFDYGYSPLFKVVSESKAPFFANNLKGNHPLFQHFSKPLLIKRGGVTFGVFGIISQETPHKSRPQNLEGFEFDNELEYLKQIPFELRKKGADVVICLAHIGLLEKLPDQKTIQIIRPALFHYLQNLPLGDEKRGIDFFLDGHGHYLIHEKFPSPVNSTGKRLVHYAQAGKNGNYLVQLKFELSSPDLIPKNVQFIPHHLLTESYPVSPEFIQRQGESLRYVQKLNQTVIAKVSHPFRLNHNPDGHFQNSETAKLVGKCFLDYANKTLGQIDFCLLNTSGIRNSLEGNQGDLFLNQLHRVVPFRNNLVVGEITGQDLMEILHERGKRLTFWGLNFEINPEEIKVKTGDFSVFPNRISLKNGGPLQLDQIYRVVTIDFLLEATEFSIHKRMKRVKSLDISDIEVLKIQLQSLAAQSEKGILSQKEIKSLVEDSI